MYQLLDFFTGIKSNTYSYGLQIISIDILQVLQCCYICDKEEKRIKPAITIHNNRAINACTTITILHFNMISLIR